MSWTDTCTECNEHRADCDCGDWCGYKRKFWLRKVEEEKQHYPSLKNRELNEKALIELYEIGKSPIDALNDLITLC